MGSIDGAARESFLSNGSSCRLEMYYLVKYYCSMGRASNAKERLLKAAGDLIWEQSYGAVTVDAICERADVKKGSFYHFFASKAKLAVAVLEAHWESAKLDLDR